MGQHRRPPARQARRRGAAGDDLLNAPFPIIDTHIHLFDSTRPQGAPYTGPAGHPPQVSLPPRYRALAEPLGVVGAIHVEASNWPEDNHWVLEVADGDPIIVGVIGNLRAEEDDFAKQIERLAANPLFRGIRYGRLWGYDLSKQVDNPAFIDAMKLMAQAGLVLDSANPNLDLVQGWLTLTDRVPDLTLIIDHLPYFDPPPDQQAEYERLLGILSERPQVFVKLSEVIHRVEGQVSKDLATHRPRLDLLFDLFGEDQVIFGSDWPNSDGVATIEEVFAIVRAFFATKPRDVAEKYFWKNSVRAYRWIRRAPNQPETT